MVVFSPWAFGTTQPATILAMNLTGYSLGMLGFIKYFLQYFRGYRPWRWTGAATPLRSALTMALAGLTVALLVFCLISALNARATWLPEHASFEYYSAISWLPQSYARDLTWRTFGNFLALACAFWAVRDWVQGASVAEERALRIKASGVAIEAPAYLPARLRALLWVLCINGALLAVESIAQRLSGIGKLLWLVEPRINKEAMAQLGPYAYRSNGAQYFNLVWPVCLGFWWTLRREVRHGRTTASPARAWRTHSLLVGVLLMAAAPIISASRAGAGVTFVALFVALVILLAGMRRRHPAVKFAVVLFFASILSTALYLGGDPLADRFKEIGEGYNQREAMFDTARKIPKDFPLFGTGPGTFEAVFQLYRGSTDEYWPAQLHNDWLETLITFGWTGSLLIALAFACAVGRWFLPGAIYSNWQFTSLLWLALAGCLLHARWDFPFQIYSILFLFLLECAILSILTRHRPGQPSAGP